MDFALDLTNGLDVVIFQIGVDGIGQTTNQQIFAEIIHHFVVGWLVKRLQPLKLFPHGRDGKFVQPVGVEELLEIQWEHTHLTDATHWYRRGLGQRNAKQRAAGDEREFVILGQELQKRQQMRIRLDFVNENQGILFLLHFTALEHADLKVEILYRLCFCKQPSADRVFDHVEFNEILKKLLTDMTDDVCLSNLSSAVNQQDFLRVALQMFSDECLDFAI